MILPNILLEQISIRLSNTGQRKFPENGIWKEAVLIKARRPLGCSKSVIKWETLLPFCLGLFQTIPPTFIPNITPTIVHNNRVRGQRGCSIIRISSQQGRIQRNRRPSYAYVNPVDLQFVQPRYPMPPPHRHQPSQRARGEQERHSRQLRDFREKRSARIDSTLRREQCAQAPTPSCAQAPVYREYTKEETCADDVQRVTTLQILSCGARTLRAQTKIMWECYVNTKPRPFCV